MTGMNPGNHVWFQRNDGRKICVQFVNNKSIKSKTLWRLLSEKGKGYFNYIPMTYPPKQSMVYLLAVWMLIVDSDFTYPPDRKNI